LDPGPAGFVSAALARIDTEMRACAPRMAGPVSRWMSSLSETGRAEDYFTGGRDVILLLPCLLANSFRSPDLEFQRDLVYSSVNAYYFIRLIDNAADQHGETELALLPAASFFHGRFQSAYFRYFPAAHPFWELFEATCALMAEAAIRDSSAREITREHFESVTARKTAGVRIPLAAVCHRYGRLDLLEPWQRFYDVLACLNQLINDLLDWQDDLEHGVQTLVLSEARRKKAEGQSVIGWLVTEGFWWAKQLAVSWIEELQQMRPALASSDLDAYWKNREREVLGILNSLTDEMGPMADLARLLEG
jgi:hypothetical protein